jgi:hypothetical protein
MLVAGLIVLALSLALALIGMVLAGSKILRVRSAPTYCRLATLLVLAAAYFLTQYDWPGVHLRQVDFWSVLVILAILVYALIWASVAYQLNKSSQADFGESFMLSMLYRDSEHGPQHPPGDASAVNPKAAKPKPE